MYFTLVLSASAFSTGAYSAYHLTLVTPPARRQLAVANITQCKPTACALGQLPAQATVERAGRDSDHVLHAYGTISCVDVCGRQIRVLGALVRRVARPARDRRPIHGQVGAGRVLAGVGAISYAVLNREAVDVRLMHKALELLRLVALTDNEAWK
ncbi:hypothetical protein PF005_g15194 [Phytophthora fragariae]|uniref:Uncharacterized protein n=2 Tax=Phytophthora fragariae TaxID=53985 RepID=A0A6A3TZY9_9STRA|nr:hypothetical protein PF003_g9057 [Phytophthora fragariae]KAE8936158.1 hypothetical protein PF009_g13920 [Phytophthora fragariae]KAE8998051.1 hypothetical protein PF011_g15219 [Phytophthora fragariae]KAE9098307.1 hypothetical protein PF007_g16321 [Phytophthora fragariae]KAE9143000.1 hypothetical protein PF006_g11945 [Phytophthora fragariae]